MEYRNSILEDVQDRSITRSINSGIDDLVTDKVTIQVDDSVQQIVQNEISVSTNFKVENISQQISNGNLNYSSSSSYKENSLSVYYNGMNVTFDVIENGDRSFSFKDDYSSIISDGDIIILSYLDTSDAASESTSGRSSILTSGIYNYVNSPTVSSPQIDLDCSNALDFYLSNLSYNISPNFTNLSIPSNSKAKINLFISQGSSPYGISSIRIGGVQKSIAWKNGLEPNTSSESKSAFSFEILYLDSEYIILGELVEFS